MSNYGPLVLRSNCAHDLNEAIQNSDIVSFDVFDTLFRRTFINPTDLFLYMEERYGLPDFHFRRIYAEQQARRKNPHKLDISLEDIYELLPENIALEMEVEQSSLFVREAIVQLYWVAKRAGKKVAVLSDMYLPKKFVGSLLSKAGINPDYFYVSGEDQVGKFDGSMFRRLLSDSKSDPSRIIHIGDNRHSDFEVPSAMGLTAFHVANEWPVQKRGGRKFREVNLHKTKSSQELEGFATRRSIA